MEVLLEEEHQFRYKLMNVFFQYCKNALQIICIGYQGVQLLRQDKQCQFADVTYISTIYNGGIAVLIFNIVAAVYILYQSHFVRIEYFITYGLNMLWFITMLTFSIKYIMQDNCQLSQMSGKYFVLLNISCQIDVLILMLFKYAMANRQVNIMSTCGVIVLILTTSIPDQCAMNVMSIEIMLISANCIAWLFFTLLNLAIVIFPKLKEQLSNAFKFVCILVICFLILNYLLIVYYVQSGDVLLNANCTSIDYITRTYCYVAPLSMLGIFPILSSFKFQNIDDDTDELPGQQLAQGFNQSKVQLSANVTPYKVSPYKVMVNSHVSQAQLGNNSNIHLNNPVMSADEQFFMRHKQSNSQHSSQQSQTFLTVPRLYQPVTIDLQGYNAYQQVVKKNVYFEDPNSLYKSEHKESLEEGELLPSRQSIDRKDINTNLIDEIEEQYKSLKVFQIELQNIGGRKLISKNSRKFSDSSDLNTKPIQYRKHSEQIAKGSLGQESYHVSPNFRPQTSPLLQLDQDCNEETRLFWPAKMVLVARFLGRMMRVFPSNVKQEHMDIINDLASYREGINLLVWDPQTRWILIYRVISVIIYMLLLLLQIYSFGFERLEYLIDIFTAYLVVESAINYNIGIYEDDYVVDMNIQFRHAQLIQDRIYIIRQYLFEDVIGLLGCVLTITISSWFVILLLIRILRIKQYLPTPMFQGYILLLIIHTITCIWYQISDQSDNDVFELYTISLQWTIEQLTNSGTNITTYYTPYQRLYSSAINIIGIIILLYLIQIVIQPSPKPQPTYPVSKHLNHKIQRYFNRKTFQPLDLSLLSQDLQEQAQLEIFKPLLNSLPFSELFKQALCLIIKTQAYDTGSIVVHQTQVVDKMYFLMKGSVNGYKGRTLITHNQFPNDLFYKQSHHPLTIRCTTYSQLAYVEITEFLAIIRKYQQDFEKYCMIRDSTKVYCQCCGYRGHSIDQCKFVFYIPNRKLLIAVHNTSSPNERYIMFRDDGHHRVNALLNKNLICITAISFAITNKLRSESDLTNDVMSRLQGSTNNFEDSVLNDFQDERSSRYSMYQKNGTLDQGPKTINSPQNTFSSQTLQQTLPPMKLDDRESSYNSRKFPPIPQKHMDHSQSYNSVKVNLVKSTVSNDMQLKRGNKKPTNSSSSLNKRMQSTSIMVQKSVSGSIIPQPEIYEDDLDRMHSYLYYFPSYNVEHIANRLNRKRSLKNIYIT